MKDAAPDVDKALKKALRAAVQPIVADARGRLSSLPGTGPRTAKNVRGSVIQNGVAVELVQREGFEFAREFGAKGYRVSHYSMRTRGGRTAQATRAFNYASPHVFDTWTGNRFTLDSGVSGRGLFPAAAAGGQRAVEQVFAAIDQIMQQLSN